MKADYLILLIILSGILTPFLNYTTAYSYPDDFRLVDTYWGSIENPRRAYPGSSNILLYIEIVNNHNYTLQSVSGELGLPTGFTDVNGNNITVSTGYVREDDGIRRSIEPGESFILTYTISINYTVSPGVHYATLNLTYTYLNGSNLMEGSYIIDDVPLIISQYPSFNIVIKRVYWIAGEEYINATPGSRGLTLYIEIYNNSTESIDSLDAYLKLSYPFTPSKVSSSATNINARETVSLAFNDIGIDSRAYPGAYTVSLKLEYRFRGYGDATKEYDETHNIIVRIGDPLEAGVVVVRTMWDNDMKAYPGSRGIYLNVEFENIGRYTLDNIIINLDLPKYIVNQSGGDKLVSTYPNPVGYGEFFQLRFGPIYIKSGASPGPYHIKYTVEGYANVDGSTIMVRESSSFSVIVNDYNAYFDVISIEWVYNNRPSTAFPGSKDVYYVIKLVYRGEDDIYGVEAELESIDGITIKSVDLPRGVITSSSTFEVRFNLDIDGNLSPGLYQVNLTLKYTVNVNGQNTIKKHKFKLDLKIDDPESIDTQIEVVNYYWGIQTPQYVYPGSINNPLTITILNKGYYDVESVTINVLEIPEGFYIYPPNMSITSHLGGGGFAEGRFYVNVSSEVDPGSYDVILSINYQIKVYGAVLDKIHYYNIRIKISKPLFEEPYLKIYNVNWLNNYKVYPGTNNTRLIISFVNDAMYPISGIHIWIEPPYGVKVSEGSTFFYISGPVNSLDTFNIELKLDFSKWIKPGYHNITIRIKYVVESGGSGIVLEDEYNVEVYISRLDGIRYLSHMWLGYSPGGGTAGNTLVLIFRDDLIDMMSGLYATLILPKGFISTQTGSNILNVTPVTGTQLNELINIVSGGVYLPPSTQVSKGEYILVPIQLIISPDLDPGEYSYTVIFNFMDSWGSIHEIELNGLFRLPGSAPYLEVVEEESYMALGEKYSNVTILVRNPGDAAIYDVYIGIMSYSQMVAFSSTLKYIKVVPPGGEVKLTWRASVNPEATFTGSFPAMISASYVDPTGNRHSINQTVILYILGLAKLKILDLEVSPSPVYMGREFSISATLVNVGKDTARNVEAYLEGDLETTVDSYTYIGDIDVGYQMPFTLYGIALNESGWKEVRLVIKFYDIYDNEYTIEKPIKILVEKPKPIKEEGIIPGLVSNYWYLGVLIAVIIFLIVAGLIIYRAVRTPKPVGI